LSPIAAPHWVAAAPAPADAAIPASALTESVVASVNDDVITNYDILQRMRLLVVTAGIQPTRNDLPELQRYALSGLIDEHLEIQELKREEKEQKASIIATDSVIDDVLADMAKDSHMTSDQFLASLAQQGISPDTLLHRLVGPRMQVNSSHHQAVREPGRGVVNAVAPDGVIEGIEDPTQRFCLGVQWHPEFLADPGDRAIFAAFVAACHG